MEYYTYCFLYIHGVQGMAFEISWYGMPKRHLFFCKVHAMGGHIGFNYNVTWGAMKAFNIYLNISTV